MSSTPPSLDSVVARLAAGEAVTIVCLGDSNTDNTGFTAGSKQWPELLHTALKMHYANIRVRVYNAGVSGDAVPEALARYERDVARLQPDLVIVCLGSNDSDRVSDADFRTGMNSLLDRINALPAACLLRTPTPVLEKRPQGHRIWTGDQPLVDKVLILRELARERALPLHDTFAQWHALEATGAWSIGAWMDDEVHTNAAGHRLVASQVGRFLGVDIWR